MFYIKEWNLYLKLIINLQKTNSYVHFLVLNPIKKSFPRFMIIEPKKGLYSLDELYFIDYLIPIEY